MKVPTPATFRKLGESVPRSVKLEAHIKSAHQGRKVEGCKACRELSK